MSQERKIKLQKRNYNDPPIMLQPDLKKSKEITDPTQASSQTMTKNLPQRRNENLNQLIEKLSQNPSQHQETVQSKPVSSQQTSQTDSSFVSVPEPENDTPNPSQVAALAQNSQKPSGVSQQESQLPNQAALILSCPVGTTINLKIEPLQERTSISVRWQGLDIGISSVVPTEPVVPTDSVSNVASQASPALRCRLL